MSVTDANSLAGSAEEAGRDLADRIDRPISGILEWAAANQQLSLIHI